MSESPPRKSPAAQTTPIVRDRRLGAAITFFLCIAAGSALGLLVVPRAPSPDATPPPTPKVQFLGRTLQVNGEALKEALRRVESFTTQPFRLEIPGSPPQELRLDHWGARPDEARLAKLLLDLGDSSSPLRKHWSSQAKNADKPPMLSDPSKGSARNLPTTIGLDREVSLKQLMRIKDELDREAVDARVNIETGEVLPHRSGRWLDVDATLLSIDRALAFGKRKASAALIERAPKRRSQDLKGLDFQSVLGHFETRYSQTKKAADRTFNLALAASRLNGSVLMPGELFDFNAVVGARDEARGYKVATVIANGELVDGIGGGTCQISGTLHGAVFFAGLDIVERYPHTRPSSYIKMGMDATVVYPTINFRFRNPYDFPIVVHQSVKKGIVRAEILGPKKDQVVTLIRKIDRAIPYEQLERDDPRLPRGTRVLAQRGIPGFRLHRYRTIRRGSHTVRERWRDVYPPTNQVVRIGTGSPMLEKSSSVGTPEYQADEVLILTQRRPINGKPGVFAEKREKGRFGTKGWTKELGMPFWKGS